jgi:hypothetical protein
VPHVFGIIFFIAWIVNFVGNGLVIYIFLKTKALRSEMVVWQFLF